MNGGISGYLPADTILVQEYLQERLTIESIAQKYSVPYSTARKRISLLKDQLGGFSQKLKYPPEFYQSVRQLYLTGKNTTEIAIHLSVPEGTVEKIVSRAGISRQKYAQAKPLDYEYAFTKRSRDSGALFHAARKFYGNKCMVCEWSECPCDVHHIVGRASGGPNSITNVIVLCPNDHRKADRGALTQEFLKQTQLDFVRREGLIEWWCEAVGPHFKGMKFKGFEGVYH